MIGIILDGLLTIVWLSEAVIWTGMHAGFWEFEKPAAWRLALISALLSSYAFVSMTRRIDKQ